MAEEFEELGVQALGTPISTIVMTEDQELFANSTAKIGKKCAMSASATSANKIIDAANKSGYPVILQAAYALGGLGLCGKAFAISSQVLIEQSMKGWKEVEYEVVCDCRNNCITVCNMEVNATYSMLLTQIPRNMQLSKSSALASKATRYPLAFIATKLGLGIRLNEISNFVTKVTSACFEPSLDYCVVKMSRWDLKKFQQVSSKLGSSMKSVGEVMAIGCNFEEAIQKAIRSVNPSFTGFDKNHIVTAKELKNELMNPADRCIFAITNAFDANWPVDEVWELTKIDKWFLHNLENLVSLKKIMRRYTAFHFWVNLLPYAKQLGFSNNQIAKFLNLNELAIWRIHLEFGIRPFVKQIDTLAAEFPAFTNYLFNTYNVVKHHVTFEDRGMIVLGLGVYQFGSSVEFDWCAVRAIHTLRGHGLRTVMINYIPETVSTNFDKANRLYFKNISLKAVLDIYSAEKSSEVMILKAKENTISCSFWKG
ncbi:hypothetical protein BY996DRAFT_8550231 [Phakopsora pachyrhizi]|nr:hypothetical protein BY996DRAFT_8550231 [Phakopsora pachyrhizi]